MRLYLLSSTVKAYQPPNQDDAGSLRDSSELGTSGNETSNASIASSSAPSSSSSSASDGDFSFSPLGLLKSRYPDAMQNLEETAEFFSAKVKRIFQNNFGPSEKDYESTTTDVVSPPKLIKNPANPDNDRQLDDAMFGSIHEEARRREAEATPGDRLRKAFERQANGDLSPELGRFRDILVYTLGAGLFLGYYRGKKEARKKFIKLNLTTKYTSQSAANRKLNDFLISAAFRNGTKTAIPLVGFMAVFMGTSMSLSTLEDEEKYWHVVVGAALAGAHNRFLLGPRAFLVGGLVGAVLGVGFGALAIAGWRLAGLATMKEKRYHRYVQEVMEDMYEDKVLPAPPRQFQLYNDIPE